MCTTGIVVFFKQVKLFITSYKHSTEMGRNIPHWKFWSVWSACCTLQGRECVNASHEYRQELVTLACLACFASLSATLFVSLLTLMIKCCIPWVIVTRSTRMGRRGQWPGLRHREFFWAAVATISLSVRKLTTCKFFLAQRLARPRGSTAYASTLQGFHVIWNENMKKMLCKGYV